MRGKCMEKRYQKIVHYIENGKCFQTFPSLRSSKIERNCTLDNTDINLQLAYYILEFDKNVFSRRPRTQTRI